MRPWLSLTLLFLAALLLGVLSFLILRIPTDYLSSDNAHNLQGILSNIFASLIFLFCIDVGRHVLFYRDRRAFRQFFGDLADPKTSRLIYPEFVLSHDCEDLLTKIPASSRFTKQSPGPAARRFVDIPHIVSSNDLLGLVIFTTGFGRFMRESPQPMPDGLAVKGLEGALQFGFISFGLTSNAVTDLYRDTDTAPLFTIDDPGGKPTIVTCKGRFGKDDDHQHGLILRYRPYPIDYPSQYWFICAGVAAVGTPASAWHLVHNWKIYHKKYGSEDFLITSQTSNNMAGYRTQTNVVHFDRSIMNHGLGK